jgi:L(+)-tartrate dehydratase beta subunit
MAHHVLNMPIGDEEVRALRAGDTVTLEKTLFGIRDATQIHMFDRGRATRFDLNGHAVIHTAPNVRKVEPSPENPAGYAPVCIGTTTSQRMERFSRPLMEQQGVRIIIGKGGLGDESRRAFQDIGGAYLAIVGGAAALETTWIEAIEEVEFEDLNPECLWRFRIKGFGPILVAMDAHGGSLYDKVRETSQSRRAAALAGLGVGQ